MGYWGAGRRRSAVHLAELAAALRSDAMACLSAEDAAECRRRHVRILENLRDRGSDERVRRLKVDNARRVPEIHPRAGPRLRAVAPRRRRLRRRRDRRRAPARRRVCLLLCPSALACLAALAALGGGGLPGVCKMP